MKTMRLFLAVLFLACAFHINAAVPAGPPGGATNNTVTKWTGSNSLGGIANGTGFLSNNGSGGFSWTNAPGFADLVFTNDAGVVKPIDPALTMFAIAFDPFSSAVTNGTIGDLYALGKGPFSGADLGDVASIYSVGDETYRNTIVTNASQIFTFGFRGFDSGTISDGSDHLVGIGAYPFYGTTISGSDHLFSFGEETFVDAVVNSSSGIYGIGFEPFNSSIIDNSGGIYAYGLTALQQSTITNSSNIYAIGEEAGGGMSGDGLSDIYIFGKSSGVVGDNISHVVILGTFGTATNSNDFVFGDTAYNYFFPGASASFAVVPTANGIPLLTNSVTISQNGTNGSPIVNMTNSATITWARSGSNWTANAVSSGTTVSVNGANVTTPNLTNTATVTYGVSGSNITATAIVPAGTASASGTANTVAKFTSATNLGNSSITDNGTTVALTSGITTVSGTQTNTATAISQVPFVAVGATGQTNDLQQWKDSTNTTLTAVGSDGRLRLPAGSQSSPSLRSTDADTGIYWSGSTIGFSVDGSLQMYATASAAPFIVMQAGSFGAVDAFFVRDAAATLQMGSDAASPVNQFLKANDGSGTDKAGANFTLEGGQGTGTGAGGTFYVATSKARTTASTVNPYTNWFSVDANGAVGVSNIVTVANAVRMPWTTLTMTGSNVSTIDLNAGSYYKLVLTNDAFFGAPSNLPGTNTAQTIQIALQQDGTGARVVTMTNSAWMLSGSGTSTNAVPFITTNANGVSVLTFVSSPFSATKLLGVAAAIGP